ALPELAGRAQALPGASEGASWTAGRSGEAALVPPVLEEIRNASMEMLTIYHKTHALALTDSLTGLGNARHLMALLERELQAARYRSYPLSLLLLDLDNFKAVNDQYGHLKGDEVLQTVAERLQSSVREGTTVCRYAGDEFVVVLPETTREEAAVVAARLEGCIA